MLTNRVPSFRHSPDNPYSRIDEPIRMPGSLVPKHDQMSNNLMNLPPLPIPLNRETSYTPEGDQLRHRRHSAPTERSQGIELYPTQESKTKEDYRWDMTNIVPVEHISTSESFKSVLKFLRFFMYAAILIVVLVFSTCNVVTVLVLEAALVPMLGNVSQSSNPYKQDIQLYRAVAINQLVWILCFPHLFQFVFSLFKVLLGKEKWPPAKIFIWMLLCEFLHTAGLTILVFKVLPYFGSFYALGLMNSVYLVPVILKVFFGTRSSFPTTKAVFEMLDMMVMFVTLVMVILLPIVAMHNHLGILWWSSLGRKSFSKRDDVHSVHLWWQIPVSLTCVSVKWWENFVGMKQQWLADMKKKVHKFRYTVSICSTFFNVGLIVGFVFLLEYLDNPSFSWKTILNPVISKYECHKFYPPMTETTTQQAVETTASRANPPCDEVPNHLQSYTPAISNIVSSLVVYVSCGLAAKLLMQPVSFLLPILLTTPVVTVIMLLQCFGIVPVFPELAGFQYEFLCDLGFDGNDWFNWVSVLSLLCFIYINRHMWTPGSERLSHNERLFITPLYTGVLLTQCLFMNRRNDDQDKDLIIELERLSHDIDNKDKSKHADDASDIDGKDQSKYADDASDIDAKDQRKNDDDTPMIYICATMWHETKNEMIQLLKSVYRMDKDQGKKEQSKNKVYDPDYYKFEAHIFFDDAMKQDTDKKWIPNEYVMNLKESIREAASAIVEEDREIDSPEHIITPYGGRLVWHLPERNVLVVHLKDKNKIRHKKRWSQVMYMYYLLCHKLYVDIPDDVKGDKNILSEEDFRKTGAYTDVKKRVRQKALHTFILALDGDVDFKPDAVKLLLDRMKINAKTGAVCGRIHPTGSGPVVWYQKFEYALGHWFQKSTEHVLGCVLCSPGCFSLFRGSALMNDNVMKRYTTVSTEPMHFLQYDQGEDRWLCTLLLKKGYRVDYTAASDALTNAPETFDEFFKQRRRWTPSTMANIIELLSDSKNTVLLNENISSLYIVYQFLLIVSTILGPATIVIAIASALETVFDLTLLQSYSISLTPVVIYIVICLYMKDKYQLLVGAFLSVMYAAVMMVVLVGILQSIVVNSVLDPSLFFLIVVSACFFFAGLLHPYEFSTLMHGMLYFLCIPAGYLVLMIYSICNLNNVSWGTRETFKVQEENHGKQEQKNKNTSQTKRNFFSLFGIDTFMERLKEIFTQKQDDTITKLQWEIVDELKKLNNNLSKKFNNNLSSRINPHSTDSSKSDNEGNSKDEEKRSKDEVKEPQTEEHNNYSIHFKKLGDGKEDTLNPVETDFWRTVIKRYLKPKNPDNKKEKELKQKMKNLRNNISLAFWFTNLLWVLFNFMIQRNEVLNRIKIGNLETQPLGFIFLIFFMLILLLQMIGMITHRLGTFLHLISITEIRKVMKDKHHRKTAENDGQHELTDIYSADSSTISSIQNRKF